MKPNDTNDERISTDVLVIGGGIAGLCAAIKAKEGGAEVLAVDKGGIGWAGQVPISGGHISCPYPGREEEFVKWATEDGRYLNNQDWTALWAKEIRPYIDELAAHGFPFIKDRDKVAFVSAWKDYDSTWFDGAKSLNRLKAAAARKGVRFLDKIYMADLLKTEGRVTGALGFGLVDNKTYLFDAKATILANGSCRYMRAKNFSVNTGDGVIVYQT